MPKGKSEEPEEAVVEYPFTLRSMTLRDVGKVPGAQKYAFREYGTPYASFDVDWPSRVVVPANPDDSLAELKAAIKELMRWFKDTGADIGREIVVDIGLDRADAALDDMPSVDVDQL